MKKNIIKRVFIFCLFSIFFLSLSPQSFAGGPKEEQEEKSIALKKQRIFPSGYQLTPRAELSFGYDTNANLDKVRKGDFFEEFLFSLDFKQPLRDDIKLILDYDLDVLNYNEFTCLSNILNHFRFTLEKEFPLFNAGAGYDLGFFYYPREKDNDFLMHKFFFYVKGKITRNLYHKLQIESAFKDYIRKDALSDTINTLQTKERKDKRNSIEYALSFSLNPKLLARIKSKLSVNDSNARFEDFYDYKSYKQSLSLDYKLSSRALLFTDFSHQRKIYSSRTVSTDNYRQRDHLYSLTLGALYKLDKNNTLSLNYTYRENSSNDSLEEYSGMMIACGWQHKF